MVGAGIATVKVSSAPERVGPSQLVQAEAFPCESTVRTRHE